MDDSLRAAPFLPSRPAGAAIVLAFEYLFLLIDGQDDIRSILAKPLVIQMLDELSERHLPGP